MASTSTTKNTSADTAKQEGSAMPGSREKARSGRDSEKLEVGPFMAADHPADWALTADTVTDMKGMTRTDYDSLSDPSDSEISHHSASTSTATNSGWRQRLKPAWRNSYMRSCMLINLFMLLVIIVLLCGLIALVGTAVLLHMQVIDGNQRDIPCWFEWTEWTACSASCRSGNSTPTRSRDVVKETIVFPRGKMASLAPCPKDVRKMRDVVPCNTHFCPIPLSSLDFGSCYKSIHFGKNISVRNVPTADQLITIDAELYKEC